MEKLDAKVAAPAFVNVNDGTCEGLSYTGKNIFTVQFHPEACPGPLDSGFLFDRFLEMISAGKESGGCGGFHPATPRPLTHDLFVSFAHTFGVKVKEVFIYRFEDGIFSSEITFSDGDRTVAIDARTSDAIAIALRTNSPMYTTREILKETGFVINDDEFTRPGALDENDLEPDADDTEAVVEDDFDSYADRSDYHAEPRPENFTIEQLEKTLAELIEKEEYEEAARISDILQRKKDKLSGNTDTNTDI